ncbi:long-chain fatty acid--CoA ligase [Leptospira perolatii]|uniref:Long-chain fatty acid--CoA ligase n=1 Tax=Leptospira perolatii TaxID=2023191 RepID=A0A2M9ZS80_9LEPT|nr:long-chain fatty acid--CoA ligase [Leptospira perolatii]PJZ71295.1 long-chain fatty acid--CoA ligase [Leptospira perolatii]PJZ74829.1 long-chain fatty acid--CoA ligase [Leptospira perolatii]
MRTLADLFKYCAEKYGEYPAFATRNDNGDFETISYNRLYRDSIALAASLAKLGLQPKDRVAVFADNRLEWMLTDMAVILCGAADVPRGTDLTDNDINYILPHSEATFLFVENDKVLEKVYRNPESLENVTNVVLMDLTAQGTGKELRLWDLIQEGYGLLESQGELIQKRIEQIDEEDLFTLIYTSGTTGKPKGVMLTHKNALSQIHNLPIALKAKERVVSILPIWHIFERIFEMVSMYFGACTYYSSVRNIKEDLRKVKPTFMASAPRIWESVYQGILNTVAKSSLIKRALFRSALTLSSIKSSSVRWLRFQELDLKNRNSISSFFIGLLKFLELLLVFPFYLVLDFIVLRKIRSATGGKLVATCSGGGALPFHVDQFFNNIGIPVLEGYGLTETSPILAVRTFDKLVLGTVGPLYPNTQLRIVDPISGEILYTTEKEETEGVSLKGEIHVKGDQIMKGYFKDLESTSKVLRDGWFNTGDLGMITYNGCLKIVGRTKETIVLTGGENVEPVPIENLLLQSPLIEQCMIAGQDRKYLCALIVPNRELFPSYKNGFGFSSEFEEERCIQKIREEIKQKISAQNGFKNFERIVDFRILPKAFEPGDELTAKLSVRRHVISEKYSHLIEEMYSENVKVAK